MEITTLKKCNFCKESKPATQEFFSPKSNSKDGLYTFCHVCSNLKSKQYRDKKFANSPGRIGKKAAAKLAKEGLKKCSVCNDILPVTFFRFNGPNIRRSSCGICHRLRHAVQDGRIVEISKKRRT